MEDAHTHTHTHTHTHRAKDVPSAVIITACVLLPGFCSKALTSERNDVRKTDLWYAGLQKKVIDN